MSLTEPCPATEVGFRPRRGVGANPAVISIDVGGTSIKGALMASNGRTVATEAAPTPGGELILPELIAMCRGLRLRASDLGYDVSAIGAVTPGVVDEATGIVAYASNLQWQDVPLRSALEEATSLPVATGHDVRAAGLAEQLFGAARNRESSVLVAIGTGIAAAVTQNGTTIAGFANSAGELGHTPVLPDGERCVCGQRGCLEVYASAEGLRRRYIARTGIDRDAEQIAARLGQDRDADAVWADAVRALSLGLVTCTLLVDPEIFVIGGGLAAAGHKLIAPLRTALAEGLAWRQAPAIELAVLGNHAARIGAGVLAFRAASQGALTEPWRQRDIMDPSAAQGPATSE